MAVHEHIVRFPRVVWPQLKEKIISLAINYHLEITQFVFNIMLQTLNRTVSYTFPFLSTPRTLSNQGENIFKREKTKVLYYNLKAVKTIEYSHKAKKEKF